MVVEAPSGDIQETLPGGLGDPGIGGREDSQRWDGRGCLRISGIRVQKGRGNLQNCLTVVITHHYSSIELKFTTEPVS